MALGRPQRQTGKNTGQRMSLETHKAKAGKRPDAKEKTKSGPKRLAAFFGAHKQQVALAAVGLCVVLAGTILVFAFAAPKQEPAVSLPQAAPSAVSAVSSAPQSASLEEDDPVVPTVLPETEDAGAAYVKETLFLGDSNTERMLYYADVTDVTVENGFGVVGMGISSFNSTGCARFAGVDGTLTMPKVVELLQPRRVVMTFGTNNVGMQVDRFIADYKAALDAVKKAGPDADIIIGSIFPVDRYRQNTSITMERIDKMNEALAALCEEEGVKFLNWGEAMLDEEIGHSAFESTIQDGVHLSRTGMTAIFQYFRTHSYVTRDRRTAPPAAAPKRIATQPATITQDGAKKAGPIDWAAIEAAKKPVTVTFGAWDETNNTAGGGSVSPGSVSVKPGGTSAAVTATAKEGYTFVGWSFASGTSGGGGATTSITVNSAVEPGTALSVTAVFRQTAPASSSEASSSSSSEAISSEAPPQSQAPQSVAPPPDPVVPSTPAPPEPPVSTPPASVPEQPQEPVSTAPPAEEPPADPPAG